MTYQGDWVCWFVLFAQLVWRSWETLQGHSRRKGVSTNDAFKHPNNPQTCHSEERRIFAGNSIIKIPNLCRASNGDSSFLGMTNWS